MSESQLNQYLSSLQHLADQKELISHVRAVYLRMQGRGGFPADCAITLQAGLVAKAVDNALVDIWRWRGFHQTPDESGEVKLPDRHKYAGFVARWIAKEKPLLVTTSADPSKRMAQSWLLKGNAIFAAAIFYSFLIIESPSPALFAHFRYWFNFRDERGDTLAFIAYLIEAMEKTPPST